MEGGACGVDWDWIRDDFSVGEESWGRSFVWGKGEGCFYTLWVNVLAKTLPPPSFVGFEGFHQVKEFLIIRFISKFFSTWSQMKFGFEEWGRSVLLAGGKQRVIPSKQSLNSSAFFRIQWR